MGGGVEIAAAHGCGRAELNSHTEKPAKADGREVRLVQLQEVIRDVEEIRENRADELAVVVIVGDFAGNRLDVQLGEMELLVAPTEAPDRNQQDNDDGCRDGRRKTDENICARLRVAEELARQDCWGDLAQGMRR